MLYYCVVVFENIYNYSNKEKKKSDRSSELLVQIKCKLPFILYFCRIWIRFSKHSELCTKIKRKINCKKWALICHRWMLRWLIGIILGEIICESSNWQQIQRLKITILGANWQLFRLERIVKCLYIYFVYIEHQVLLFVMKIKKLMLPIWLYNRGWFPLGNKYLGCSFWMG